MIIIFIFILIILIYIILQYYLIDLKRIDPEYYNRVFPPVNKDFFQHYYKVVTPLKPLISPLKDFKKNQTFPDIYIYNPKYFSPVRDQGRCGACWAFVICSMLSDNVTIKIIKFGKDLNVQQLLSCYTGVNPCDGEAPEDVLIWLQNTGFKLSIDSQYLQTASQCVPSKEGISVEQGTVKSLCKFLKRESIKNKTEEEYKLIEENIYNMKMQLLKDGPFFGSISVYEDFYNFLGNSVYVRTGDRFVGGHAIEVVGWVDKGVDLREGFQDGYWVCKNSWGLDWAPGYEFPGYFAIKMGVNECGIESRSGCAETNVEYTIESKEMPDYLVYNSYKELLEYIMESKIEESN